MIRLNFLDVGLVEETASVLLVLQAPELRRLLVIETGFVEGESIVLGAEGVRGDRPLTHDLLHDVITKLGARVEEVRISDFHDETFYAKVVVSSGLDGATRHEFDARPSDAIAIALRARAPIYASDKVLAEVGVPEERTGRFAELFEELDDDEGERTVH